MKNWNFASLSPEVINSFVDIRTGIRSHVYGSESPTKQDNINILNINNSFQTLTIHGQNHKGL